MKCLVCGAAATENLSGGDYLEIDCPDCGVFRITRSLIAVIYNRVFDVEKTRYFLEKIPRAGSIPMLSTLDEECLRVP